MFFHYFSHKPVQVFCLDSQVHAVIFNNRCVTISHKYMMLVQVAVTEIALIFPGSFRRQFRGFQPVSDPVFWKQAVHLPYGFFCLVKEMIKAVYYTKFKFCFSPFAPDKIPGTLHFPYMAFLLFFYTDRPHIPFFSYRDLTQLAMEHGKPGNPLTDLIAVPDITFPVRKPFFHNITCSIPGFA